MLTEDINSDVTEICLRFLLKTQRRITSESESERELRFEVERLEKKNM